MNCPFLLKSYILYDIFMLSQVIHLEIRIPWSPLQIQAVWCYDMKQCMRYISELGNSFGSAEQSNITSPEMSFHSSEATNLFMSLAIIRKTLHYLAVLIQIYMFYI